MAVTAPNGQKTNNPASMIFQQPQAGPGPLDPGRLLPIRYRSSGMSGKSGKSHRKVKTSNPTGRNPVEEDDDREGPIVAIDRVEIVRPDQAEKAGSNRDLAVSC
jgi:hypothetical protein